MALTNAERQRRHYQRKKEKEKEEFKRSEATSHWYLRRPISDYDEEVGEGGDFDFFLGEIGINSGGLYRHITRSAAEAEKAIAYLLEAAKLLAQVLEQYKTNEINDRIKELQQVVLKENVFDEEVVNKIASLATYREELARDTRFTLPQWKLKGE